MVWLLKLPLQTRYLSFLPSMALLKWASATLRTSANYRVRTSMHGRQSGCLADGDVRVLTAGVPVGGTCLLELPSFFINP